MALGELRAIKNNVFVASAEEVEKTFPWDIGGLNDCDALVRP